MLEKLVAVLPKDANRLNKVRRYLHEARPDLSDANYVFHGTTATSALRIYRTHRFTPQDITCEEVCSGMQFSCRSTAELQAVHTSVHYATKYNSDLYTSRLTRPALLVFPRHAVQRLFDPNLITANSVSGDVQAWYQSSVCLQLSEYGSINLDAIFQWGCWWI